MLRVDRRAGDILIDLSLEDVRQSQLGAEIPNWIAIELDGLHVRGDDSLSRETFVAVESSRVLIGTSLVEMVQAQQGDGKAQVSPFGVSHILGTGFVPFPGTAFEGIYRLGAGDDAHIEASGSPDVTFDLDYPWMPAKSRQDETPSTDRLYELMAASVERHLDRCDGHGLLMLSSGKDSVGLAIALAEVAPDVPCFTYRATKDNVEHEHAARFCKQLGLNHRTIEVPTDTAVVRRHLTTFFENAVAPSADHAMIPFILSVAESGVESGAIIDGGGNDGYMGYFASPRRRKLRLARIRGRWLVDAVARASRIDSKLNYAARARPATAMPGRNMRYHEIQPIYRDAVDPSEYWYESARDLAGLNDAELAAASMTRQLEGARTPEKVRIVARATGMESVMPYCDPDLAQYVFHLPVDWRYVEKTRSDKVLLTQLLSDRLGYDSDVVGSGFFSFDGGPFFEANAAFVKEEILTCDLWEPAIADLVDEWIEAIPDRPFLFHALLSLFMVSGWRNHSRFVAR
jgi:asparagine synthetase B (glutamine-hydrolysing)